MTTVGSAVFELLGDSSEFREALNKASAELATWGAETQQAANHAVAGLGDVTVAGLEIRAAMQTVGAGAAQAASSIAEIGASATGVTPAVRALEDLEVAGLEIVHSMDAAAGAAKEAGAGFKQAGDGAADADRKVRSFADRMDEAGNKMESAGRKLSVVFTLPLLALGGAATKAAVDFESSFAGIRKTMDLTERQFGELSKANRTLAKTIPTSVNELNRIGELGGQLGVRGVDNIVKFERTIAQLAVTTDLTADSAALSFAQIVNVLQLPQGQIDRLGAAVVDLGNNFATTESRIVDFIQRIAGAGQIAGLSAGSVAGIGAAFASMGIESEAGGTAVQRVLIEMVKAVSQGGESLDRFADTAGVTSQQFAETFRNDAAAAFTAFVEGLGRQGEVAINTLEELGLMDARLTRAFLAAAGSGDLLTRAIERGNQAFTANTALVNEAEKRFATFRSQLTLAWNRLKDVAITLGNALLPALIDVLDASRPIVDVMAGIATAVGGAGEGMSTAAVAVGGLAAGFPLLLIVAGQVAQSLTAISTAAKLANISLSAGALGLLIAGAGLVAGFVALAHAGREAAKELRSVADATKLAADQAAGYEAKAGRMNAAARELERIRLEEALARQRATLADLNVEWEQSDRVLKRLTGTGKDFVAAQQREPALNAELEAQRAIIARLEAQYKALQAAIAGAASEPPPVAGTGGLSDRIKEIQKELATGLTSAARLGTLLGDSFDPAAEKADVLRAAIEDLVAENVAFDARVGPQGQTLRELVNLYLDTASGVEAAAEQVRDMARATSEADAITRSVLTPMEEWQAVSARLDEHLFAGRMSLETYLRALTQADKDFREATGNTAEQVRQIEALAAAHRGGENALKAYNREQFILAELAKLGADATVEQMEAVRKAAGVVFDATNKEAVKTANDSAQAWESAGRRMSDAFIEMAESGKLSFRGLIADALKEIARLEARIATSKLLEFFRPGGGKSKGEGFDFGGLFKDLAVAAGTAFLGGKIGGKASGGSVLASHPYIVGERGPELFVPRAAGTVVSNAALAGGTGGSSGSLAAAILSRLGPIPVTSPEVVATHTWYRRLFDEMVADGMERGVRFGR